MRTTVADGVDVNVGASPPQRPRAARREALAPDLTWPTAMAAGLVALAYLPVHGPLIPDMEGIAAGLAVLYAAALSVMAPMIIEGIILRAGGGVGPIVLMRQRSTRLATEVLGSRWRIAAIIAGTIVSLAGVAAGAVLSAGMDPGTPAHEIAGVALTVNAVLLAGVLFPAPGFTGWALLLALIDATCAGSEQRVQLAARVARVVGVPILGAGSTAAALAGSPPLAVVGILLAVMTWRRCQQAAEQDAINRRLAAAGQDALVRFLCVHTAGQVARRVTRRVRSGNATSVAGAGLPDIDRVLLVEAHGEILGAIGPRQRSARRATGAPGPSGAIMVPIGSFALLEPRSPAVELLPEMARHGFALVFGPAGLAYVDPAQLGRRVGAWAGRAEPRERGL
jgi:hypothetical protein